jgi:hypothetical protein
MPSHQLQTAVSFKRLVGFWGLLLLAVVLVPHAAMANEDVHVIFLTDCSGYTGAQLCARFLMHVLWALASIHAQVSRPSH